MASLHHHGHLEIGETFQHFGTMGTCFYGEIEQRLPIKPVRPTSFHPDANRDIQGLIISIRGSAWVTGIHTVLVQKTEPFPAGYTVGDKECL